MTSDTKATAQDQASIAPEASRARPWRVLGRAGALVLLLGAGWIAGVKTHETIDVAQFSSTAWTQVATFEAALESAATQMASWTTTPRARSASVVTESAPATPASEGAVERTTGKIDQVRAASEAAVEGLRGTIDRVAISAESNHRELATKLEDLRERLDRIERNAPSTAGPVLSKLEQLNERLDRIERSTAAAPKPPQAPALAISTTPALRSSMGPVEVPKPAASPALNLQGPIETRKIPNWVVREVINGKAILQGPRGVISVSRGGLVPGVGRVQSIGRQGGRWIVATNNGVISAR